jgi:anti-sigma factor RsiW
MPEHAQDQLPFYVAGTLPAAERTPIEQHLAECATCRAAAQEWRAVALGVRSGVAARPGALPPLSPVVRAQVRPRRHLTAALTSAVRLVWAQRIVLTRGGILPVVLVLLTLGVALALGLPEANARLWFVLIVPVVAAVSGAFLYSPEADPAFELIAATPTPAPTLVLARLTCVLGAITGVALIGSVPLSRVAHLVLGEMIAAWFGPMALLAALATVLALLWRPLIAAGITLSLWISVIGLLQAELWGQPVVAVSLRPLLQPGGLLLGTYLGGAVLLGAAGWWLLARTAVPFRPGEA